MVYVHLVVEVYGGEPGSLWDGLAFSGSGWPFFFARDVLLLVSDCWPLPPDLEELPLLLSLLLPIVPLPVRGNFSGQTR